MTARLGHPGVVPVYGLVQGEDGQPCYAMRFIDGETLSEAIRRFHDADGKPGRDPGERSLALRELLDRFVATCNTIAYAHSRGILHRDIKPGNIMLGKYGETLVVDWGLAKAIERDEQARLGDEETLTPTSGGEGDESRIGAAMGTPAYMSPEQAEGRWDSIGPATDIYSLGATLYVILTESAPLTGSGCAGSGEASGVHSAAACEAGCAPGAGSGVPEGDGPGSRRALYIGLSVGGRRAALAGGRAGDGAPRVSRDPFAPVGTPTPGTGDGSIAVYPSSCTIGGRWHLVVSARGGRSDCATSEDRAGGDAGAWRSKRFGRARAGTNR